MKALQVIVLPHLVQSQPDVLAGIDPLAGVDDAPLRRRDDLAPGQGHHRDAHAGEQLAGQARRRAVLEFLEIREAVDRFLEPPEGLTARHQIDEGDHVGLQVVIDEILVQLVSAALVEPGEVGELVHAADGRLVGEQVGGRPLAREEMGPGEPALDDALVDGVHDFEEPDHRTDRKHLGLQPPAGHGVDPLAEVFNNVHVHAGGGQRGLNPPFERLRLQRGHGRAAAKQKDGDAHHHHGNNAAFHDVFLPWIEL